MCSCLEGGRDGLLVLSGSLGSESEHVDRLVASESSSPVLGDLVVLVGEVGLGGRDEGGESGLMGEESEEVVSSLFLERC